MNNFLSSILAFAFALMLSGTVAFAADMKDLSDPSGTATEMKGKASQLLDINTASEDQLKKLPGVGDTYSKKIIDGRPYANKEQLKSKKIIPSGVYDKIKGMIIAKQP
ncbi:MAG: helix-hairpin-helix domain-containing protein [Geobacter sp.]|nr:MAG: helix-hairpin-helix domain-containing protein [Geobacter sp.]